MDKNKEIQSTYGVFPVFLIHIVFLILWIWDHES